MTPRRNPYAPHPGWSRRRRRASRRSSARTSGGSTTSTGTGMPARKRAIQSTSPPMRTSVLVGVGVGGLDHADRRGDLARRLGRRHRHPHQRRHLVDPHGDALGHERGGVGRPAARRHGRPVACGAAHAVDAERAPVVRGRGRRRRGTTGSSATPADGARRGGGRRRRRRARSRSASARRPGRPEPGARGRRCRAPVPAARVPDRRARAPRRACRPARGARSAGPGRAWSGRRRPARRASGRPTGTRSAARRRRRRPRRRRAAGAGGGRRRRARSRRSDPSCSRSGSRGRAGG